MLITPDDFLPGSPLTHPGAAERFFAKLKVSRSGCWEWVGNICSGYGRVSIDSKVDGTHRVTYESLVGPIPDGLMIDHLCRFTACCNPEHLEPVTRAENMLRSPRHSERRKSHCKSGHPMSGENLGWQGKKVRRRVCLTCRAALEAASAAGKWERRKAKLALAA